MNNMVDHINELESLFFNNQYNGSGEHPFFIKEGQGGIMVSAPHAVNHFREGNVKWADRYTGGIAMCLHEMTGCSIMCASRYSNTDPNYDPVGSNKYQDALKEFVESHDIKFLIDLHGAARSREYAVEVRTTQESNSTIADLIENIFETHFSRLDIEKRNVEKRYFTGKQNTVAKFITEHTDTAGVQLEINAI